MSEQKNRKFQPIQTTNSANTQQSVLPTFLDHINELRRRFFWVAAFVLVISAAVYPFQQQIINLLTAPLGGQQLYYTTPVGGFTFIIKICTYIGILAAIPLILYHIYRYLEPLMSGLNRKVVGYVLMSSVLAAGGVAFAYYVSLPAALSFLTGLDITQVHAMLTVDAYLSFVMIYLLGAALLFQIPLLLLIINGIKPLKPRKLMSFQRYVLVAAFIIAAVISPTPDIMNQLFLAVPIVAMYQFGVILVWAQQRLHRPKSKPVAVTVAPSAPIVPVVAPLETQLKPSQLALESDLDEVLRDLQEPTAMPLAPAQTYKPAPKPVVMSPTKPVSQPMRQMSAIDGMRRVVPASMMSQRQVVRAARPQPATVVTRVPRQIVVPARSVDGMFARPSA